MSISSMSSRRSTASYDVSTVAPALPAILGGARRIQVADHGDLIERRVGAIRLDMGRADAGADHRDTNLAGHRRLPSRAAIAWACRANSITLKQWACGMARSGAIQHVGDQVCGIGQVGIAAIDVAGLPLIDQEQMIRAGRPAMSMYLRSSR